MVQRLDELLQSCTVKITVPGQMGWGTGFFVAPGLILTCAHVVKALNPGAFAQISWQQEGVSDAAIVECIHELDLALLRFSPPQNVDLPCVYLDREFQPTDNFYTYGYPDSFPDGASVTSQCEGDAREHGVPLILFKSGLIRPGFSGSPLLNLRTGKVCGIVKFTRDRSIDLGGGAVPAAMILAQFPELVEQQRSFHQHDRHWSQRMQGAIAANPTILPATRATLSLSTYDPTTWVGRDTLIATLTRKLQEHCRILAIVGITGIGKTALAERLVLDCLSPSSSSPTPSTPYFTRLNFDDRALPHDFITAATTLLPKLGHPTTPDDQKDPQRLLARLLQILRTTPYLVQIDSLEMLLEGDDEQGWTTFKDELWLNFFQQLLAGDECQSQFILTSQALPEALEIAADRYPRCWHRQELGGLSETEQLEIFQKNGLELDESAIDYLKRLGKLYDGHPLVLQVIAKDILDRPFYGNVPQYWQRYQTEFDALERDRPSRRHAPRALQLRVMQRVEQSLQRLPVDARNLLCRSAVYRRPVPEAFWLAMLGDLPEDRRWNALEVLKSHNLAEEELAVGTDHALPLLRQHNLIRRVAANRLQTDPTTWNDAHRTAADLWQTAYEPAPDAPNFEQVRGYLEAFDHYYKLEDWRAAKNIFFRSLNTETKYKLHSQLGIWGYYWEQIQLCNHFYDIAHATNDCTDKRIALGTRGSAYFALGFYNKAIKEYEQAVSIAREIDDIQGEGNILGNLGLVYYSLGNNAQSIELLQKSLSIHKKFDDRINVSYVLGSLGYVYESQHNFIEAIQCYEQQLSIAQEVGERRSEGNAFGGLGSIYYRLGNYSKAIGYHQKHLTSMQEVGDRRVEAGALGNLGAAYCSLQDFDRAIQAYQVSLAISCEIDDQRGASRAINGLGFSHWLLGEYLEAIEYYQQGLTFAHKTGDQHREGRILLNLSAALIKLERYSEAQQYIQLSLKIFKELDIRDGEAEAFLRLAELHHKTYQPALARECCDAALALATGLGIPLVKECEELRELLAADVAAEKQHEG